MLGLMILLALGIYIGLSALVVWQAARWARRHNRRAWMWGGLAAFAMYNLVFWDWIPTVAMHKYYCVTEAGFWVYKTPEQWAKENPGVLETLVYKKEMPHIQTLYGRATVLNQRFLFTYKYEGPFLFNRWRIETEIRDSLNSEVIAREVSFSTSQERRQAGWSGWKIWLDNERCSTESHRDRGSFDQITALVEGAKQ